MAIKKHNSNTVALSNTHGAKERVVNSLKITREFKFNAFISLTEPYSTHWRKEAQHTWITFFFFTSLGEDLNVLNITLLN